MPPDEDRIRRVEDALLVLPERLKGIEAQITTQNGNVARLTEWKNTHEGVHLEDRSAEKVAKALREGQKLTLSRGWKAVIAFGALIGLIGSVAGTYSALTGPDGEPLVLCRDFRTQNAAAAYFSQHPLDSQLDPDGDGIACEELVS